jgi:predicted small lipoprotein YifL
VRALLILLLLSVVATACGKKPGALDPPEDSKNIPYPRTYPTK